MTSVYRASLLCLSLGLTGCSDSNGGGADANQRDGQASPDGQATPDAMQATPDAMQATPDAMQATPDAMQATPDATAFDAGPPDAATTLTVGFCRLQFPDSITTAAGTTETIYGRVYVQGLTDLTLLNDEHPSLLAQVGLGPNATDPAVENGWAWTTATPNPGYKGQNGEPNNDEYQGDLLIPLGTPTEADYAFRFSGDNGVSWLYCDTGSAGSSDGYQVANAGSLVIQ